jgi:zinc protease
MAFPAFERRVLDNGVRVWTMPHTAVPVVTIVVLLDTGTAADPSTHPGLASLTSSLMGEGAGTRDAIAMSDALARIGSTIDSDTGADVSTVSMTAPVKHLDTALSLIADVVRRPTLLDADLARVRDLRLSRLKQSSLTATAAADRTLLAAVFGTHPYGHGALGTTRSISAVRLDDVREFWAGAWLPDRLTVIVCGDVSSVDAQARVARVFGDWSQTRQDPPPVPAVSGQASRDVLAVHRPGAAQTELRVGQLGPPRNTPHYHALVAFNAIVGGLFTSRINRNLRETRAITYGARTSFDMRRAGGLFAGDTSVQGDATAVAAAEILRELQEAVPVGAITAAELEMARSSITRGYVKQFETPIQLARALVALATYGLPDDTFDQFVPRMSNLTLADLARAAAECLRPAESCVVVVGDLEKYGESLQSLGRPVMTATPEF